MNIVDIIVLGIVAVLLVLCIRINKKKKTSGGSCCGGCKACAQNKDKCEKNYPNFND